MNLFVLPSSILSLQEGSSAYATQAVMGPTTRLTSAKKIHLKLPTVEEDRLIAQAAQSEPEALPLTEDQLSRMAPIRVARGRQELANKKLLTSMR
jgi:hypothetical protein